MGGTLLLVGVLVLIAYVAGYLTGRAEMDRIWRWRTASIASVSRCSRSASTSRATHG